MTTIQTIAGTEYLVREIPEARMPFLRCQIGTEENSVRYVEGARLSVKVFKLMAYGETNRTALKMLKRVTQGEVREPQTLAEHIEAVVTNYSDVSREQAGKALEKFIAANYRPLTPAVPQAA